MSSAPYKVAFIELAELKKQLKELLENKCFRLRVSPRRTLMLLNKKKDGNSKLCVDYK